MINRLLYDHYYFQTIAIEDIAKLFEESCALMKSSFTFIFQLHPKLNIILWQNACTYWGLCVNKHVPNSFKSLCLCLFHFTHHNLNQLLMMTQIYWPSLQLHGKLGHSHLSAHGTCCYIWQRDWVIIISIRRGIWTPLKLSTYWNIILRLTNYIWWYVLHEYLFQIPSTNRGGPCHRLFILILHLIKESFGIQHREQKGRLFSIWGNLFEAYFLF